MDGRDRRQIKSTERVVTADYGDPHQFASLSRLPDEEWCLKAQIPVTFSHDNLLRRYLFHSEGTCCAKRSTRRLVLYPSPSSRRTCP